MTYANLIELTSTLDWTLIALIVLVSTLILAATVWYAYAKFSKIYWEVAEAAYRLGKDTGREQTLAMSKRQFDRERRKA